MGSLLVQALVKVIEKNPGILDSIVEAGVKLLVAELQKKAGGA